MEAIKQLESNIEGWLKPIPHLPAQWRKWLGENAWWLTLIGVVLSALGVLTLVGTILAALAVFGAATTIYGVSLTPVYSIGWMLSSVISLAALVLNVVLTAMAVTPLQTRKKKGWDLLFMAFLVSVASGAIGMILRYSDMSYIINNLVSVIFSAAVGAYILFEIRSQFSSVIVAKKVK